MQPDSRWDLALQGKGDVLPTVEVDVHDDNDVAMSCMEGLRQVLEAFGQAKRQPRATIYAYEGPSVNFGRMTNSIFFAVAGRGRLIQLAHAVLGEVPGADVRYGDYIPEDRCVPCLHVEGGVVWAPEDGGEWVASR